MNISRSFAIPRSLLQGYLALSFVAYAAVAEASTDTIKVLSYNVAALPPLVAKTSPEVTIPLIAARFDSTQYDLIVFQEGFVHGADDPPYDEFSTGVGTFFYDTLVEDNATPSAFQVSAADAATGGTFSTASGLGRLSTFPFTQYFRNKWDRLEEEDALSDKGYSFARHELETGVFLDIYNWHANAGSSEEKILGREARRENIEELIKAINANSTGNAVIVIGDSNTLYPRSFDTPRRLLGLEEAREDIPNTENLAVPLKDVWIELARGGAVPVQDDVQLKACSGVNLQAGTNCEHKDKIFYRSGTNLQLVAMAYFVETDFVHSGTADQLSDHYPAGAQIRYTVPEPQFASLAATALLTLAALIRLRSRRAH